MKINKVELLKALEKVKPGLASKDLIEQATSFAFIEDRVVTYNDEISISHPVEGLNVVGAIKAQALYDFLNKIKKDEIDIEWEENQVIIKAGKSKAGLVFEQEVKLPVDEEIGKVGKWKKLPKNFLDALKFCHPCCSRDMSRPVLTCVNVSKEKVEASDTYQIVRYMLNKKLPVPDFLIPATAVRDLVKYDLIEIAEGEKGGWIHFKATDGTIFSSRVINNKFPDIDKLLELDGIKFGFPKNIREMLERAYVFSKEAISGNIPTATISIRENQVKLSAENEYGWFEENARVKYSGASVEFSVGVELLLNLFDKLQNCVIGNDKIGFSGENWKHVVAVSLEGKEEKRGKGETNNK